MTLIHQTLGRISHLLVNWLIKRISHVNCLVNQLISEGRSPNAINVWWPCKIHTTRRIVKSLTISKMSFERVLGQFLKWFHFLGQSTSSPVGNVVKYIPTVVLLLVASLAAIVLCVYSNSFGDYTILSSFSKIANVQLGILLASNILVVLIVVGQGFFMSSQYSELYARIHIIEELSRQKFLWNLDGLRCAVISKMRIICVVFTLPYIVTSLTKLITPGHIIILSCDFILASLNLITYFHVLFFIQLLNHMLQALVKYIELRTTSLSTTTVTIVNARNAELTLMKIEMYYFKLVHFNLWEFAEAINDFFGWIFLLYFLDHFIYVIYISFQTCIIFMDRSNLVEILRKFCTCSFSSFGL